MMRVRVLFFARARELAGSESAVLDIAPPATVGQLRRDLAIRFPELANFLPRCQLAIDDRLASDSDPLAESCIVAVLPPVSGGGIGSGPGGFSLPPTEPFDCPDQGGRTPV